MRLLSKRIPNIAGEYDRRNDVGLGAIGTRLLTVFIPLKALISGFFVIPIINPVSAGLAEISFGHRLENGTIVPDSLMVATPIAAFVARVPVQGVDLRTNPLSFSRDTVQITMTISVAGISAGQLAFITQSDSLDI